jgi:hypothetical protein
MTQRVRESFAEYGQPCLLKMSMNIDDKEKSTTAACWSSVDFIDDYR